MDTRFESFTNALADDSMRLILIYNKTVAIAQEVRMERSPTSPSCQHAMLARSPVGHLSVCPDCGVVHLSMD